MLRERPGGRHTLLALLALAALFIVAGCGVNSTAKKAPSATQILASANDAKIRDYSFTYNVSINLGNLVPTSNPGDTSSLFGSDAFTMNGDGKVTTDPQRADITLNMPLGSYTVTGEEVVDGTTSYTKIAGLGALDGTGGDQWIKTDLGSLGATGGFGSLFDTSTFTSYKNLKGVTLVGKDTLNGVPVYHLKGAQSVNASGMSVNATTDLWVRQDNYFPAKLVEQFGGSVSGGATITFTAINSGFTIATPSPDQVASS